MAVDTEQSRRVTLVERELELAAIQRAIELAAAGAGSCVVIRGAAGIGTTALVDSAEHVAVDAGLRTLRGSGVPLERAYAWGVVRELLGPVVDRSDPVERAALLAGGAQPAAPLFAADAGPTAGSADDEHARLQALYEIVVRLCARAPLALLIDDLHLADPPSIRFAAYLARRAERLPLAVVAAVCDRPRPDAAWMLGEPPLLVPEVFGLQPLSEPGVARLVEELLGLPPHPRFVQACLTETGGNPYLTRELVLELAARGIGPAAGAAETARLSMPETVRNRVEVRLARLPPETRPLALAIAVLGDTDLRLAAEVANVPLSQAAEARALLDWSGMLRDSAALGLVHPIVARAVTAAARPAERAAAHARAARLLLREGAAPERVARHLLQADPVADAARVTLLRKAAAAARVRGDHASGAAYLRRALAEPATGEERFEVLSGLGAAELGIGPASAAVATLEQAAVCAPPACRVTTLLELATAHERQGDLESALGVLVEARSASRSGVADALRLEARELAVALLLVGQHGAARRCLEQLSREVLADQPGDPTVAAWLAEACAHAGRLAEARTLVTVALPALEPGEVAFEAAASAALLADELETAAAAFARLRDTALKRSETVTVAGADAALAEVCLRRGELATAETHAREAVAVAVQLGLDAIGIRAREQLASALLERGALEEAALALGAGLDGRGCPDRAHDLRWGVAAAAIRLELGDARAALVELERVRDVLAGGRIESPAFGNWRVVAVRALAAAGEPDAAIELAQEESTLADAAASPERSGRARRLLGALAPGDEGVQLLRASCELLAGTDARVEHARSLLALGERLLHEGARREAREPLRHALDASHRAGAFVLEGRARGTLVAAGARPRRASLTGADALTRQELTVATLAAQGSTNREIAGELYLARRTVERHLTNAYVKLGVRSRRGLAAALSADDRRSTSG